MLFLFPGMSIIISYLLRIKVGYETFFTNWFPSFNFAFTAAKPRQSVECIDIKASVLPPIQPFLLV